MNTIERTFSGVMQSVPESRAWVGKELELAGVGPDTVADAVLVLSELLTNALVHGRSAGAHGSVLVRLRLGVTTLRLEVTDAGAVDEPVVRRHGRPLSPAPVSSAEGGHGLALVEAFSARWWTRGGPHGRTVGAEIARDGGG